MYAFLSASVSGKVCVKSEREELPSVHYQATCKPVGFNLI